MYSKFSDFLPLSWRLVIRACTIALMRTAENYFRDLATLLKVKEILNKETVKKR